MRHSLDNLHEEIPVSDRVLFAEEMEDLLEREAHPPEVTFATQDFPVDALVSRLEKRTVRVPQFGVEESENQVDGFQRSFVWTKAQMDRFIESLLLGYPVPGIFMVKQLDNVMLVLDGQQRLETLRRFYSGLNGDRAFKLENVGDDFKGITYSSMDESLRLKLDDSFIHATIVATDGSKAVNDAVYGIFERLNAGGTQLTPHEIRVALYAGPLMVLVERLNNNQDWRVLYGPKNRRIRDHELVMRILALFIKDGEYSRPLKKFLNNFSEEYRTAEGLPGNIENLFIRAVSVINEASGRDAFRRSGGTQVNTAQAEALVVSTMKLIEEDALTDDLPTAIDTLRENLIFEKATTRATADNDSVRDRLREASNALRMQ